MAHGTIWSPFKSFWRDRRHSKAVQDKFFGISRSSRRIRFSFPEAGELLAFRGGQAGATIGPIRLRALYPSPQGRLG